MPIFTTHTLDNKTTHGTEQQHGGNQRMFGSPAQSQAMTATLAIKSTPQRQTETQINCKRRGAHIERQPTLLSATMHAWCRLKSAALAAGAALHRGSLLLGNTLYRDWKTLCDQKKEQWYIHAGNHIQRLLVPSNLL